MSFSFKLIIMDAFLFWGLYSKKLSSRCTADLIWPAEASNIGNSAKKSTFSGVIRMIDCNISIARFLSPAPRACIFYVIL